MLAARALLSTACSTSGRLSFPFLARALATGGGTVSPSPTRLADVLRLDALAAKSGDDVAAIWLAHHGGDQGDGDAGKGRIGAVLPAHEYATFAARSRAAPTFILPLAKPGGGLVTLVTQVQAPVTLVTTLDEFRAAGAAAPAHTIITHYPDFAQAKGVALVRADVLGPHIVSTREAGRVVALLHGAYTTDRGHALVKKFTHAPASFDFDELLAWAGLGRRDE